MRNLHFKSKEGYRKWLAYGHIRTKTGLRARTRSRNLFATTPGHSKIFIHGMKHMVKHKR